ncbi:DUF6879 family protein [Streptomyces hoynatensis]|uniref:DUF6879 family protein n=1 Tax=Streptomyces hoynatensis TaxID=1141874 RepID=UPI003BA8B5DC
MASTTAPGRAHAEKSYAAAAASVAPAPARGPPPYTPARIPTHHGTAPHHPTPPQTANPPPPTAPPFRRQPPSRASARRRTRPTARHVDRPQIPHPPNHPPRRPPAEPGVRRNHEAGEEIRYLPRHHIPDGFQFPADGNDWWLFDGETLAVTHFRPDGRFEGAELITDAAVVSEAVRVRDELWSLAIPYDDYTR